MISQRHAASAAHVCALTEKASVPKLGNHNNNHHLASAAGVWALSLSCACGVGKARIPFDMYWIDRRRDGAAAVSPSCWCKPNALRVHFPMRCFYFRLAHRRWQNAKPMERHENLTSRARLESVMGKKSMRTKQFVFASHVHYKLEFHKWNLLQLDHS